jgi:Uma2 family endonuclease
MSATLASPPMTLEVMLAMPDNGMDRELIRGELREKPSMLRNRRQGCAEARIATALGTWLEDQTTPRGEVVSGDAGFRLQRNPDTGVGIDVAYVSAEVAAKSPDAAFFEGAPILAVEILSPSDTQQDIDEKVSLYLELGVAIVWVANVHFKTICVYRPDAPPLMYHRHQVIDAEPNLPGFSAAVDSLFS